MCPRWRRPHTTRAQLLPVRTGCAGGRRCCYIMCPCLCLHRLGGCLLLLRPLGWRRQGRHVGPQRRQQDVQRGSTFPL